MREGWEEKKLEELANEKKAIVSGPFGSNLKVADYRDSGVPIIRLQNVGKGHFIEKDIKYIEEEKAEELKSHSFVTGDIVLAKLGIPIGKTCIIPDTFSDGIILADIVRIRPDRERVSYKFLEYFLNTDLSVSQLTKNISGATRPRVNLSNVRSIIVPIPPMSEQKQIVTTLDKAFKQIDQAKENLEKNLNNAKELFQSKLNDVFSQRGEGWEEKDIKSVATIINGYSFKSGDFSSEYEIKSIKITNVGIKEFIEESSNRLPFEFLEKYSKVKISEGNLVLALTRTIISSGLKIARVPKSYNNSLLNQRVAGIIPNSDFVDSDYLYYYFSSNIVYKYVLNNVNTLMQPNLSISDLKEMPIPITSIEKQRSISLALDSLSQKTDLIIENYQQKLNNLEELKKSILQKAFRGELG